MKISERFSRPTPYLAWLLVSSVLLAVTRFIDPYVFALSAYGTAGVTIVLLSWSLMIGFRPFLWALLGAIPTLVAFVLVSAFGWN